MPNTLGAGLGNVPFPSTTIYPETVDNGYPNALMTQGWCTGVPADTTATRYAPGALLRRTDATLGQAQWYINSGTALVPVWAAQTFSSALNTGIIAIATNATTAVNLFTNLPSTTTPFSGTITGVFINSLDTTASNITLAVNNSGVVTNAAIITKGTAAGAMVGTTSFIQVPIIFGGTATVVSSGAGNAIVYATYITAAI